MEQVNEKEKHAIQMEQLMERRQRQVQRMSTTRMLHQLIKSGFSEVGLEGLSRQELMNILAEDLALESLTFWWKLCEQKRFQIQKMRMVQLKQYVVKVGYREEWLRNQPRVVVMEIMAKAKLAEEEKEEKRKQDEERRRCQEKQEQEEKEEKRRREEKKEQEEKEGKRRFEEKEAKEKEEREAQRRQEELRLQCEKEKEEKEYAVRVLELRSQRKQR